MKRIFLYMSVAAMMAACGGEGGNGAGTGGGDAERGRGGNVDKAGEQLDMETTIDKSDAQSNEVQINLYAVGEEMTTMAFEPTRIEVPAGATVHVTLMNKAKSPAMIHNAVFIKTGKQQEILEQALDAGPDKEYIPENDNIIAHTPLAQPEETVEVTFTAPDKKGTFQYICTYPGHSSMKGILIVN